MQSRFATPSAAKPALSADTDDREKGDYRTLENAATASTIVSGHAVPLDNGSSAAADHYTGRFAAIAGWTPREREVYGLLARGYCNKEIASSLSCSIKNVEFHVTNLLRKTKVASRLELVVCGLSAGIEGAPPTTRGRNGA